MNTFERLLTVDAKKVDEMETKTIRSKRLAFVLGEKEPVEITIRALTPRELKDVETFLSDKNGKVITSRYVDVNFMICAMGIVDPPVSDPALKEHFGVTSAQAVCEKIFQTEAANIAVEITNHSGADLNVGAREEIKN